MRTFTPIGLLALVLCATQVGISSNQMAVAQRTNQNSDAYYNASSTMRGKTVVLPIGTTFEGRIDKTISSSSSKAGQAFTITVTAPVLANGSEVLIPSGSQVMGEVVEAIRASSQKVPKGVKKPLGKLRVQLNGLRTPDGATYPLVGSLVGESLSAGRGGQRRLNPQLGQGVAYVGSEASFNAVAPGVSNMVRGNNGMGGPRVTTKREIAMDPILGTGFGENNNSGQQFQIRSLVKHGLDLYIIDGSPLTVRIDAPFKMAIAAPPGSIETFGPMKDYSESAAGKRFSLNRSTVAPEKVHWPYLLHHRQSHKRHQLSRDNLSHHRRCSRAAATS